MGGATKNASALPVKSSRRCARRWAELHYYFTACRCWIWWKKAAALTKSSSWRRPSKPLAPTIDQHRHWLARGAHPHHRHPGAARRLCLVTQNWMGKVGIPLITTNRINTRKWPSRCWPRAAPIWCRWRPPFLADPAFCRQGGGQPRRRNQHLYWLQPGLSGPYLCRQAGQLSGQPAGLPRNRAGDHPAAQAKRVAVVGAGPAGLSWRSPLPSAATR